MLNPNGESGGGPFARGRARASAMGVWRTPKDEEYANPEGLVGRKVRVYFDGDCTFFEAKVLHTLLHRGLPHVTFECAAMVSEHYLRVVTFSMSAAGRGKRRDLFVICANEWPRSSLTVVLVN